MSVRKSQICKFLWYYDLRLAEPIYEPPSFVCWTSYYISSRRFDIRQIQNLQKQTKTSTTVDDYTREYWMIYRGPGFLAVVWFGSSPTPFPPHVSLSQSSCVTTVEHTDRRGGGGRGWARSQVMRPRKILALKSFNTLWRLLSLGEKRRHFRTSLNKHFYLTTDDWVRRRTSLACSRASSLFIQWGVTHEIYSQNGKILEKGNSRNFSRVFSFLSTVFQWLSKISRIFRCSNFKWLWSTYSTLVCTE